MPLDIFICLIECPWCLYHMFMQRCFLAEEKKTDSKTLERSWSFVLIMWQVPFDFLIYRWLTEPSVAGLVVDHAVWLLSLCHCQIFRQLHRMPLLSPGNLNELKSTRLQLVSEATVISPCKVYCIFLDLSHILKH